jgi:hypothetical protein
VFYRLIRDAVWLSIRWHRPDGPYSTHQLAEDVTALFLHGFAASAHAQKNAAGPSRAKEAKEAKAPKAAKAAP